MGHIFIVCGPPGVGKTTLLSEIVRQGPLKQLHRVTTRAPRPEEGDNGRFNPEYEFLSAEEFMGRLAEGKVANFIEWNQNFYCTDVGNLETALNSSQDYVLHEDMPSAIHLKRRFGSRVTIILLFTEDLDELLRIQFAAISRRDWLIEWERRLGLKYAMAIEKKKGMVTAAEREAYIKSKMRRALPDLAFIAGRIKAGEDIRVMPNRKDRQVEAVEYFKSIYDEIKQNLVGHRNFAFVLMPFGDVRSDGKPTEVVNFDKLYYFVIKPAVESEGITCWRGDEISKRPDVLQDVIDHIQGAQFIIADISGRNPNVFLELGMCLHLNKDIILISRDERDNVPFNALKPAQDNIRRQLQRMGTTSRKDSGCPKGQGGWGSTAVSGYQACSGKFCRFRRNQ